MTLVYQFSCLIGVVFLLYSCGRKEYGLPLELQWAEALMQTAPDSALEILERMPPILPSDKKDYATWCLLLTQARDKNYIEHTSDSLISIALSYFEEQSDPLRKAQACFYAGQVQRDRWDDEQSAAYYVRARDEIRKTTDYRLAYLICSNLGMVYAYRSELKEEAKEILHEANQYARLSGDSIYLINSFSELGRVYSVYEQWDRAASYYEEAIRISEQGEANMDLSLALGEAAYVYMQLGEEGKALSYLQRTIKLKEKYNYDGLSQTYLLLGNIYVSKNRYDSAVHYLEKALDSTNPYTLKDAYRYLYELNKKNNYSDKAIIYNDMYWEYADSLNQEARVEELLEIKEKYDHEKLINENNRLIMEHDQWVKTSLIVLLVVFTLLAFFAFIYQRILLHKEKLLQQTKNKILLLFNTIEENNMVIEGNRKTIEELSFKVRETEENRLTAIERASRENERLQNENLTMKDRITAYNQDLKKGERESAFRLLFQQVDRLLSREKFLVEQLEGKTSIFNEIRQSKKVLSEKQWQSLKKSTDLLYDNFTTRLSEQFPQLNEQDIQYCCFMKLGLSNDQIATLAAVSPQSVIKRKQRIRYKVAADPKLQLTTVQSLTDYLSGY